MAHPLIPHQARLYQIGTLPTMPHILAHPNTAAGLGVPEDEPESHTSNGSPVRETMSYKLAWPCEHAHNLFRLLIIWACVQTAHAVACLREHVIHIRLNMLPLGHNAQSKYCRSVKSWENKGKAFRGSLKAIILACMHAHTKPTVGQWRTA